MLKKEGVCWSCIKWDSRGGAYVLRYKTKYKGEDRRAGRTPAHW